MRVVFAVDEGETVRVPCSEVTEGQLIAAGYSKYLADKMKDEGKEYLYG